MGVLCWVAVWARTATPATLRWGHPGGSCWKLSVDGSPPAGVHPVSCGIEQWCLDRDDVGPGSCWDITAVGGGVHTPSSNGPVCIPALPACLCDLNGDGAVGLDDLGAAIDLMDLALLWECFAELQQGARC